MTPLAALTLVTACGLFQPPQIVPQVSGVEVVQSNIRTQGNNPGVTPVSSSVKVLFSIPMNQPSVERSTNIYQGSYDAATNPLSFQKLQLTSMCNGQWRVRNPNTQAISFNWDVYGKTEKGLGVAAPSSDTFFQSTLGSNTVRTFVGSDLQQTKATNPNPASCSSNLYSFTWSSSNTVQVTPNVSLKKGQPYTLAVTTAAKNESGTQALSLPFTNGFVVGQGGGRESGVLQPGGTFVNSDGVRIESPVGATDKDVNVWVEHVDPASVLALPLGYTLLGGMYRIGATERTLAKEETFNINLPLPNLLPSENGQVALISLINDASIYADTEPKYELIWWGPSTDLDLNRRLASVRASVLDSKGIVYALAFVAQPQSTPQAQPPVPFLRVQVQQVPLFEINCDATTNLTKNCQCPQGTTCNQVLLSTIAESISTATNSFLEFTQIFGSAPRLKRITFQSSSLISCKNINAGFDYLTRQMLICLTDNGTLLEGSASRTVRHETFHAVQGIWVDLSRDDLRPVRRWVVEATATASESSSSNFMNADLVWPPRIVNRSALNTIVNDSYRLQDFWVFTGRKIGRGLGYVRPIFETGLNDPVTNVNSTLTYGGGLEQAYSDWALNQGALKTLLFRNDIGSLCTLNNTISGTQSINVDLETQLISQLQLAESFAPLTSKAIRLTFANQTPQNMRLVLSSTGNVRFTVYRANSRNPERLLNCPDATDLTSQILQGKPISVSSSDSIVVFASNASVSSSDIRLETVRDIPILLEAVTPYNGPAQMCARVKATVGMDDLPPTSGLQIIYFIDDKPAKVFGSEIKPDLKRLLSFTRSCNLSEGAHTLEARITSSEGSIFGNAVSSFIVENNLWPGRFINGSDRCPPNSAYTLKVSKTNPAETFTVAAGESSPQFRRGNVTTTYDVRYPDGESWAYVNWVFPIPYDGDPESYGYFQNVAHWLACGVPEDHRPGIPPGVLFRQTLTRLTSPLTGS